jgi:hypothetical protein
LDVPWRILRAAAQSYLWIEIMAPYYEQDNLNISSPLLVEFLAGEMEIRY